MCIYYGNVHYGINISGKTEIDGDIFLEPIFELKFTNQTIKINDYLEQIKKFYLNLIEPEKYQYELLVDISSSYSNASSNNSRGYQNITYEQMTNFIDGKYKMDYL